MLIKIQKKFIHTMKIWQIMLDFMERKKVLDMV